MIEESLFYYMLETRDKKFKFKESRMPILEWGGA